MASYEIMENFEIHKNQDFLKKASDLSQELKRKRVTPKNIIGESRDLKKGDKVVFDFGNHYVGYLSLKLGFSGSHPDAPLFLKLKFAEMEKELHEKTEDYKGWISKSWIEEEWIHVDVLPTELSLDRRYAFRFLQLEVIDTSQKYSLNVEEVTVEAVSAVDINDITLKDYNDELLNRISKVGAYTLQECMQQVFEDGPKRDRRLWLGDLRLQALANYKTFKNYDLVKRCLYLFAGLPFNDNQISACLFIEPEYECDDTYLMDYALFFVCALYEYYEATGDISAVKDMYEIAMQQVKNVENTLDDRGIIVDKGDAFWCFVDWSEGLNKQTSAQAIFIYALKYAIELAKVMDDNDTVEKLKNLQGKAKEAAIKYLYDEKQEIFVSGKEQQISYASQVWMLLADVLDEEKSLKLLQKMQQENFKIKMVTPYMYHYYIEALLKYGKAETATEEIKKYWGGMINAGADTFWELYNPQNPEESPYGGAMVNSYCHAWSCTPVYLLEKIV